MEERWKRQEGILPEVKRRGSKCVVIGVGGLGSFTAMALGKMGVGELVLYDPDVVEGHNVSNQLFRASDVGEAKVVAMQEMLEAFCPEVRVSPRHAQVTGAAKVKNSIICSCVDSMRARKGIAEAIMREEPGMLVDVRSGADMLRIFTVPWGVKEVWERYLETLYEDREGLDLPCTARAIIYTGFLAGAVVSAVVKAWLMGEVKGFGDWSVHVPTMEVIKGA